MDLWNEYEGRSIDGLFPLKRLIRPEGRSAFFTTTSSGTSTVIRLIESHFDEDEILARWTGVSDLHQPNLLTLTRFGQAMMDETSLVYAVLEPTEADLSQILCERPLTLAETRQVASSLIPALQALHAKGYLHEHIQPANVLAVGEVVKLRSDCIREAPEGPEGTALRARDVQDLATLLLQCLTQQRNPAVSSTSPPLPAPFREIIHNGISGTWGLAQMAAALEATAPQPISIPEPSHPVAPARSSLQELHRKSEAEATPQAEKIAAARPEPPAGPQQRQAAVVAEHRFPEPAEGRIRVPIREQSGPSQRRLVPLAVAVVCLILFAAYAGVHRRGGKPEAAAQTQTPQPIQQPVSTTASTAKIPDVLTSTAPAIPLQTPARSQWRVVAFTYNKQDQAAAKARTLEQRYASLHPAVFTPTGHAPYLVTLGGPLNRDAAVSLKNRLRGRDLPRDLYTQNYSPKSR
jgi:hypothetical protein